MSSKKQGYRPSVSLEDRQKIMSKIDELSRSLLIMRMTKSVSHYEKTDTSDMKKVRRNIARLHSVLNRGAFIEDLKGII